MVLSALVLFLFAPLRVATIHASVTHEGRHSAMATLSSRAARPGDHVELIVTIRSDDHPSVHLSSNLAGLRFQILRKAQRLTVDGENVWLFRYRVTPMQIGDYEIPPLQVIVGNESLDTKSLLLHVSKKGETPPLSSRELAFGVDIPDALSEEVLKSAPQPTPIPDPVPNLPDARPLSSRVTSSALNALKSFWNYPGK